MIKWNARPARGVACGGSWGPNRDASRATCSVHPRSTVPHPCCRRSEGLPIQFLLQEHLLPKKNQKHTPKLGVQMIQIIICYKTEKDKRPKYNSLSGTARRHKQSHAYTANECGTKTILTPFLKPHSPVKRTGGPLWLNRWTGVISHPSTAKMPPRAKLISCHSVIPRLILCCGFPLYLPVIQNTNLCTGFYISTRGQCI